MSLPPDLSELMKELEEHAHSFISMFDDSEPRTRQIEGDFQKIPGEVEDVQKVIDESRRKGAVGGLDSGSMQLGSLEFHSLGGLV